MNLNQIKSLYTSNGTLTTGKVKSTRKDNAKVLRKSRTAIIVTAIKSKSLFYCELIRVTGFSYDYVNSVLSELYLFGVVSKKKGKGPRIFLSINESKLLEFNEANGGITCLTVTI